MDSGAISKELRLKRVQRTISRMPSLSTTVMKVLEICNDPNTSPNDLNKVVSLDPVLTGKVLRLVNSAYYSLPSRVSSLTRAIIMLGMNTVKNMALSTAVLESLGPRITNQGLDMDQFWTHSICTGVTAKALAELAGVQGMQREEFFVAGLLHDLGKIPLNNRFPDEYDEAVALARDTQTPLYAAEEAVFGFDHRMVGGLITEKWRLSGGLGDAIRCHHDPEQAGEENRLIAACVGLANAYANLLDVGFSGDPYPAEKDFMSLLKWVGVPWEKISALSERTMEEINKAKIFLQVVDKDKDEPT